MLCYATLCGHTQNNKQTMISSASETLHHASTGDDLNNSVSTHLAGLVKGRSAQNTFGVTATPKISRKRHTRLQQMINHHAL
jgi:hypothetical protein